MEKQEGRIITEVKKLGHFREEGMSAVLDTSKKHFSDMIEDLTRAQRV